MASNAFAPGKVILTGEHFVVHSGWALAAALTRGTVAHCRRARQGRIRAPTLGLETPLIRAVPAPLRPIAEVVRRTLRAAGSRGSLDLSIESDLPPASGLGSSSSAAVATAAATAAALGHSPDPDTLFEFGMEAERRIHGNPSGIDVAVAIHGGALLYRRGKPVRPLKVASPFELVVASTGVQRRTSDLIRRVASVRQHRPALFEGLARSSSSLSHTAAHCLATGDMETLGAILTMHHSALSWIGVSTPDIDRLVGLALAAGALGAKLTGAGGGGSIIALPVPGRAARVVSTLKAKAAHVFTTMVPAEGVKVWQTANA